ncbi:PREDICTED: endoplasmic reticulum-Golgi intermediate compartment protein 2 [Nicrophorus vespilloides]|uniref:Endoplasmic reticulum-Golgi intermediate compartment protein 2 n=1 Tax=Nicrophorus vespilloides TaxID=110193 RepID=A0ABM1MKR8_NICVS|nr:PREDICTED: endoplasmic reticulum-Golgi intermediate compartment protein 2 [Nicrophorus vespilloides]
MENEKIVIRYRGSKLTKVKELDLFPKIEDTYREPSSIGGTLSVFSFLVIFWLICSEIHFYLDSKFVYRFSPDTDFDGKLKINVDITVAMPCNNLGADILDSTNQNAFKFGKLKEESTWFELSPNQKLFFDSKRHFNSYLRDEYHAVVDLLWKRRFTQMFNQMPARTEIPNRPFDACRIHGSLILNKVAGNFHITAGKSLSLPRGHIHISAFMSDADYNFTHRIDRLSFGDASPGIIHPLEGDEFVAKNNMILYQYFVEVVPTSVKTFLTTVDTYQYSVKELTRPIDHNKGSHGMPGIYFKYDVAALKVTISQERDHLGMFLAKLCSVVGGIYVCSGFINTLILFLTNLVLCRAKKDDEDKSYIIHESNLVFEEKPAATIIM